ncbi:MAG: hypothetical protein WCT31_00610 [Candidatus Micrarchaeia archaeon]
MWIIYIYDIKTKNKKEFNRVKRMFYYTFNKLPTQKFFFRTKSVLLVPPEYEQILDNFFNKFKPYLEVYKVRTKLVEEL